MSKFEFVKGEFVASLPQHVVLWAGPTCVPYTGSMLPPDVFEIQVDDRIIMSQVLYTTVKPIHGVLHYEGPTQLFFLGYQCGKCEQVFLVPGNVADETALLRSMRHGCVRDGGQIELDLRTHILHCVQDIGRPGGIGLADCEQWTDVIMGLTSAGAVR